jgi:hypothetical protein
VEFYEADAHFLNHAKATVINFIKNAKLQKGGAPRSSKSKNLNFG